ncbi:MAG TPA: ABC transporter ATP-binding protein [Candidatus Polarisedimenticolaceae bacterium]|nr:ABC transporter ATP-binding protein [Candidatus Polarisedimenticolaceae bacterium]
MSATERLADSGIVFDNVSKFYGEVLGINRVHLSIPPGITSLVGPNGSGKTTVMNLMTGLLQPSQGEIRVLGIRTDDPEQLFRHVGYCTQYDSFPRGFTGEEFVHAYLRVHGYSAAAAQAKTRKALERVGMTAAAARRVGGYSKGMRQRIKLAQAIAHDPSVLVLDEPLNGLDPMAREEMLDLFRGLAAQGNHVIISSHILHEVDFISDQVILLNEGYVIAEGNIRSVRSEMQKHPLQILIRCDRPAALASRVFEQDGVVEARIDGERGGLLVKTRDADSFYLAFNRIVLDNDFKIEVVTPADEDVDAVYQYLIGGMKDKA